MKLSITQTLQQAITAHNQGKIQEAENYYRTILKTQPTHPHANHNLGIIATSMGKPSVALPLFKIALNADRKVEQFWASYISALIEEQQFKNAKRFIIKAKKSGFFGEKIRSLEALLRTSQEQAKGKLVQLSAPSQGLIDNMLSSYKSGHLETTRDLALSITQNFPEHLLSWQILGSVFKQLDSLDDALIATQKTVEFDSNNATYHNDLGSVLRDLDRLLESEVSFRKAIELKPNFAEAYSNLGNTLQDQGRYQQAEASYSRAIVLKPDYAKAYSNLSVTQMALGKILKAEASCRQAIALKPNYAVALYNLGIALRALSRADEAKDNFMTAIELAPDYANSYNQLGSILMEFGKPAEAKKALNKAIALQPNLTEAIYNLGTLLNECGDYKNAATQFRLSDFGRSKSELLRCLYMLDLQSEFYQQVEYLMILGVNNALVGSVISRAEMKYGIKTPNPFCNDPVRYAQKTDLTGRYNFKKTFVKGAFEILNDDVIQSRTQGLLSKGIQTSGNLFSQKSTTMDEIQKVIRLELEQYRVNFKDSKEGLIKSWPIEYTLNGWLVSMKNGGKLDAHIHEEGWISGSIYINVPPKSNRDSGNLVVCTNDEKYEQSDDKNKQSIDVVTGSLCLFPSSLMHYTIPFESDEERIVLAFDMVPKVMVAESDRSP
jgi:tetratricopeptide (TPR) repeat protein